MDGKIREIIDAYKKRTEKECCFINYSFEFPTILDDKIGGKPYLPVGEEYPKDKYGNPMALFMQVNLTKLDLEGYPKGILELFVPTNEDDLFDFEIADGSFETRLFEEDLEYQTILPDVKLETFLVSGPIKIEFNKGKMSMPYNMGDDKAVNLLLDLFEEKFDVKINYPSDLEKLFGIDYYDLQDKLDDGSGFASHVGAYAAFINDPYIDYYDKEECLIFIGSNLSEMFDLGNASSFYVLISRKDLLNKDFSNVTCNFEWS